MNPAHVGWAQVNGVTLRYAVDGAAAGTAPDLVLLHEMGGCLESWDAVVQRISPWARVLRFDMRGAGLSEKRHEAFELDDLVDDLHGLLADRDWSAPVTLVGCAVGAAVALRFAARFPAQVCGLLAMSPATGLAEAKKPDTLQLADFFEQHGVRARLVQRFDRSYPERFFPDAAARQVVWGRLLSYDPVCYAETCRMLCRMDIDDDLARIACPALLLGGLVDGTRPPEMVADVARRIPGALYRTVDSGHVMPVLTPDLVAGELLGFVNSLRRGPASATRPA